jgi:hypothetical protein
LEVDPVTALLGANTAVRLSEPAEANVVVVVATPPVPTATGVPIAVPPVWNVTVPAGALLSLTVTVAVRVTVAPVEAGFGDAVSVTVVLGWTGAVALVL